jgi:hypothetical protein
VITTSPPALAGPAPETSIVRDMVRRAVWVAPVMLVVFGLVWGVPGALSTAFGLALVLANFALSAFLLATSARISLGLLMAAALFGFLIRMGLILAAVWAVHDLWWFAVIPLAITIVVTHLGLLAWELRYVSATLAFPGLRPEPVPEPDAGPLPTVDPAQVAAAIAPDLVPSTVGSDDPTDKES